jgi:RNA-binding protein
MELTKKQLSWLRSQAHPLAPLLQLGKQGANEGFLKQLEEGLERQELVKIRVGKLVDVDMQALAAQVNAVLVQKVGRMAVFFRRAQEPKLELPR